MFTLQTSFIQTTFAQEGGAVKSVSKGDFRSSYVQEFVLRQPATHHSSPHRHVVQEVQPHTLHNYTSSAQCYTGKNLKEMKHIYFSWKGVAFNSCSQKNPKCNAFGKKYICIVPGFS